MQSTYFIINNIEKRVESDLEIRFLAARVLNVPVTEISDLLILREALDARKKKQLKFLYNVALKLRSNKIPEGRVSYQKIELDWSQGMNRPEIPPVIIGAGPAGLFAALGLLIKGYKPVLIEQGKRTPERHGDIVALKQTGRLSPGSNILFGEGGAGAYSDGKLTARNRSAESDFVFETLVAAGAPPEIAWQAKPHLGTDRLARIIPALTDRLIAMGADIRFGTQVTDVLPADKGRVSVVTNSGTLESDCVVPAIGHSADALYRKLHDHQIALSKKTFAAGVRIEHPSGFINARQYGDAHLAAIAGASDYKLTAEAGPNRGVYSFCVCPGGEIINASSDHGRMAVNGMSASSRAGGFTNGAVVVTLLPTDFPDHPLAGLDFREKIERECSGTNPFFAPAQTASGFMNRKTGGGRATTYKPGTYESDLMELLPETISKGLVQGLTVFDRQIRGFIEEGMLVAPETGTSSPVRILRNPDTFVSVNCPGLYPVGEGAGYAGGIVSSAVDGLRMALTLAPAQA